MNRQERETFDGLLEEHLASLPEHIVGWLEEVPLIVEDEPDPALLWSVGMNPEAPDEDLCGLHSGVPLTERSVEASGEVPDEIRMFRGPILRLSGWSWPAGGYARGKLSALDAEIRITLLHELGHHFGLDEDDLEALGYA